ncbi:type II toxin-antitoxin system prevent-host-death family antitoxin [Arthrobacter sp.]|uniref:type II toxin-antitoxin system prevent-host-death family antitoxin n=1 Tax=Arthrobacter sp. TaxID=1667 RepID=UPI003A8DDE38
MKTDTRNIASVTTFSQNVSTFVRGAEDGEPQVIMRNNRPAAVLMGMEDAERLSRIDELEDDLKLLTAAMVRIVTDKGNRHSLSDVAGEFGIDLNDLSTD